MGPADSPGLPAEERELIRNRVIFEESVRRELLGREAKDAAEKKEWGKLLRQGLIGFMFAAIGSLVTIGATYYVQYRHQKEIKDKEIQDRLDKTADRRDKLLLELDYRLGSFLNSFYPNLILPEDVGETKKAGATFSYKEYQIGSFDQKSIRDHFEQIVRETFVLQGEKPLYLFAEFRAYQVADLYELLLQVLDSRDQVARERVILAVRSMREFKARHSKINFKNNYWTCQIAKQFCADWAAIHSFPNFLHTLPVGHLKQFCDPIWTRPASVHCGRCSDEKGKPGPPTCQDMK